MLLNYQAESSLRASLIDTVTGLPKSIDLLLPFGGSGAVGGGGSAAAMIVKWVTVSGAIMGITFDGGNPPAITSTPTLTTTKEIFSDTFDPVSGASQGDGGALEIVLEAPPLDRDAYGNPIAAARAATATVTIAAMSIIAKLSVTNAGDVSIFRFVIPNNLFNTIAISGITGATANLYAMVAGNVYT